MHVNDRILCSNAHLMCVTDAGSHQDKERFPSVPTWLLYECLVCGEYQKVETWRPGAPHPAGRTKPRAEIGWRNLDWRIGWGWGFIAGFWLAAVAGTLLCYWPR